LDQVDGFFAFLDPPGGDHDTCPFSREEETRTAPDTGTAARD